VGTTTVDVVRVCVMRVRARQLLRVYTKPLLYTTAADRKLSCACKPKRPPFLSLFVMPPSAAWHVGSLHVLIYAVDDLEFLRLPEQVGRADIENVILAGSSLFLCEPHLC
jgi:hypothetical protein